MMAKLPGIDDDKQYQLMQALLEAIPGMMFHVKRDGTYLEFLSSMRSKPLFPPEKFLGKKISDIMPPEIAKRQMLKIEELFTSGKPQIDEYSLLESGEMHWYKARFAVSGEDTFVAVVREITEERKAEDALRESEATLKSIFRAAPIGIGLVSNRILKKVNDRICQMTGYTREELLEKNARILYPTDEDYEYVGKEKYRQISKYGTGSVETRWLCKDGTIINVLLSSTPLDPSNLAAGVTFTALDITERKEAEEALRISENRFRSLIEQSPFSIIIYRSDGGLIFGNEAASRLYGISDEEYNYLKENYSLLNDEQLEAKGLMPYIKKAFAGEGTTLPAVEYLIPKIEDTNMVFKRSIWVEGSIYPIKDDQGHVREVVLSQNDITERKLAEEERRQRTRELTAINLLAQRVSSSLSVKQVTQEALQAVADAVTPDLAMLFLRQGQLLTLQGFGPINTTYHCEETPVHVVGECLCGLAIKAEKPIFSIDIHNDPRCTWTECKKAGLRSFAALPLRSGDNVIGVLGVACATTRDFEQQAPFLQTLSNQLAIGLQNALFYEELQRYADKLEQRVAKRTAQLEEKTKELEQANSRLKRADQLKSVFLASMSHELRTPLNSIIGFTGILLMELAGTLNNEQKKQLKMVKNSANHLLNMINDILDISKIEAGKVDLSLEKFLLDDVINEVKEIFSNQVTEKGLELITNIPQRILLFSDMRRIKQILINLVSNAVKFTKQGRITVTSTILPDERLEISVADTGIGIKAEAMDKLFNPFQQVDMNLTKQFEGTGLGLYLCKSLVNLLGGEISAKSEYKKGSVFTFILPLK
jgi:PAS domain S-box-containing protein